MAPPHEMRLAGKTGVASCKAAGGPHHRCHIFLIIRKNIDVGDITVGTAIRQTLPFANQSQ